MPYDLRYETRPGRCAWCWEAIDGTTTHTVISSLGGHPLELRFHHHCWPPYRSLSEIELAAVGVSHEWPPPKIEALRIHSGLTVREFSLQLGAGEDTYRRILEGDATAFGPGIRIRLRGLAVQFRFEQTSSIDWGDARALFNLRMRQGWSLAQMAREMGASTQQVALWDRQGVPQRSVRTWGRLAQIARRQRFDAAMIVDDRLWTREYLVRLLETGGRSHYEWARAGRCSRGAIQQWAAGTRPLYRDAAWHLTVAAAELGLELPPVGLVPLRKGKWSEDPKPRSPEAESRRLEALRESKWTLNQVELLGTVPDRVLARQLGRSRNSVAIMRRTLGIATVDARGWDGQPRPQSLSREELQRRWDQAKKRFVAAKRALTPEPAGRPAATPGRPPKQPAPPTVAAKPAAKKTHQRKRP